MAVYSPATGLAAEDDGVVTVYRWLGAGLGAAQWDDPDNWHPEGVPDSSDVALFSADGQHSPAVGNEIRVGTLAFDDSLTESMQISATNIYIEDGIQVSWNIDTVVHHEIHADLTVYFLEVGGDGLSYYPYTESQTIDASYEGSTLDLMIGPDAVDFYNDAGAWTKESHSWDFEFGILDEVGDVVPVSIGEPVIQEYVPGWGTALAMNGAGLRINDDQLKDGFLRYSFSIWFNLNSLEGTQVLYEEGSNIRGIALQVNAGQLELAVVEDLDGYSFIRQSPAVLETGQWYMATVVFHGLAGIFDLYVDGVRATDLVNIGWSPRPPYSVSWHGNNTGIGQAFGSYAFGDPMPTNGLDGYLDNLMIYQDLALSDADVAELYAAQAPLTLYQWSFDNNLWDSAPDTSQSPTANLWMKPGPAVFDTSTYIDAPASLYFDGAGCAAIPVSQLGKNENGTVAYGDHAVSLWFKADSVDGTQVLYEKGHSSGHGLRLNNGRLEALMTTPNVYVSSGANNVLISVGEVTPNQWHLATMVYNQGTGTLSLSLDDMVDVAHADVSGHTTGLLAGGWGWGIGGFNGGNPFDFVDAEPSGHFSGHIDRVIEYDTYLTVEAIEQEFLSFSRPLQTNDWTWDSPGQALDLEDSIGEVQGFEARVSSFLPPARPVAGSGTRHPQLQQWLLRRLAVARLRAAWLLRSLQQLHGQCLVPPEDSLMSGYQHLYTLGQDREGLTLRLNDGFLEAGVCAQIDGVGTERASAHSRVRVEENDWQMATLVYDGLRNELSLYSNGQLLAISYAEMDSIAPAEDAYAASIGYAPNYVDALGSVLGINSLGSERLPDAQCRCLARLRPQSPRCARALYDEAYLANRWSFEQSVDESLEGLTGDVEGSLAYDAFDYVDGGYALDLPGGDRNGAVYWPGSMQLFGDSSHQYYTLSLWVLPEYNQEGERRMIYQNYFTQFEDQGGEAPQLINHHLAEVTHTDGTLEFQVFRPMYEEQFSSAYYLDRVTSDALREGEWNLITCVFESFAGDGDPNTRDDIRLSIYVNGEPGSTQSLGYIHNHNNLFYLEPAIGFSQHTPAYHDFLFNEWMHADAGFKGLIDDVRLYEHPWTRMKSTICTTTHVLRQINHRPHSPPLSSGSPGSPVPTPAAAPGTRAPKVCKVTHPTACTRGCMPITRN